MGDYEAFTVAKQNIEDDRALLQQGTRPELKMAELYITEL